MGAVGFPSYLSALTRELPLEIVRRESEGILEPAGVDHDGFCHPPHILAGAALLCFEGRSQIWACLVREVPWLPHKRQQGLVVIVAVGAYATQLREHPAVPVALVVPGDLALAQDLWLLRRGTRKV